MRSVYKTDVIQELEFVKRAANAFKQNDELYSYTDKEIEPGCFLALRWGGGRDCVLVLMLDEYHEPTNYQNIVMQVGGS